MSVGAPSANSKLSACIMAISFNMIYILAAAPLKSLLQLLNKYEQSVLKPYILGGNVLHSFGNLVGKAEEVFSIQRELIYVI